MPLGETPYIYKGSQTDLKRLFYSDPTRAFAKGVSIPGGMGVIPAGTVMATVSESTNRAGLFVPYTIEDSEVGNLYAFACAYLVTDGAASTSVYITLSDSYKFAVGDHLALADDTNYASAGVGAKDLGAITAIDRTTYNHMAVITVTNALTTDYTVAQGARVWIQTTTAAPFTKAVGILKGAVDTGSGENAKGAEGVIVIRNAMLYKDNLYNYDSEALTDMSWASESGSYLIM